MLLKKWEDLPDFMKNDEVKVYYDVLDKKRFSLFLKRIFDIVMSVLMIIVISPVLLLLAGLIKIDSKGPVFYRQARVTQYGRAFGIYKFRTMRVDADKIGALVTSKNDSRITTIGKKIRKCRLDELPQLFNILVGDMSFVGTRPEVMKFVDSYTDEMKATLLLPAGVTSLASIEFKDEDEIIARYLLKGMNINDVYIKNILPQKMLLNLHYLEKYKFITDISICFKTLGK